MAAGAAIWAFLLAAGQIAPTDIAQTSLPAGPDGPAIAAAAQLDAIIQYARWPVATGPLNACLIGDSALHDRLTDHILPDGRSLQFSRIAPGQFTPTTCDIALIGRISRADERRIIIEAGDAPVLTITDADPGCTRGSMICWNLGAEGLGFDLNIGSVAQSSIRIDPRVLTLGWHRRRP